MKYLYGLLASLVLVAPAFAGGSSSDDLTWVPPTQYVDGTPLPAAQITEYVIRWGNASGVYTNEVRVAGNQTAYTLPRNPPHHETRCYVMRTVAGGLESVDSQEVCKRRPGPPDPSVR